MQMRNRVLGRAWQVPAGTDATVCNQKRTPANPEAAGKSGTFRLQLSAQSSYTGVKPPSCRAYVANLFYSRNRARRP